MILVVAVATLALAVAPIWLVARRGGGIGWSAVIALAMLWVAQALVTTRAIQTWRHGNTERLDDAGAAVVALGIVVLVLSGATLAVVEMARRASITADRARRLLDWILYAATAIVLVVALLLWALHQAKTGGSTRLPLKWLGFAGLTGLVFGYAIKAGLRTRSGLKFWVLLGGFFAVHAAVGVFTLLRVDTVPLLLYALLTVPEYMVLLYFLDYFLASDPRYR